MGRARFPRITARPEAAGPASDVEAKLKTIWKTRLEQAAAGFALALAVLVAVLPAQAQARRVTDEADPVQAQAWVNAGTRGSAMTCDYMPASCDGWRSGGSTGQHAGGSVVNASEPGSWQFPAEKELRPGCEQRWETLYAPTLRQLVSAGTIAAPTYEAYAKAYGKPRNVNRAGCT